MEFRNSHHRLFKKLGKDIIKANKEILILVRYPARAGSKDFFLFRTEEEFEDFLKNRKSGDSITLFKSFEKIIQCKCDADFVDSANQFMDKDINDWLIILPDIMMDGIYPEWNYLDDKEELLEFIEECIGDEIVILKDPDWLNYDNLHHAYEPGHDGLVRYIGSY